MSDENDEEEEEEISNTEIARLAIGPSPLGAFTGIGFMLFLTAVGMGSCNYLVDRSGVEKVRELRLLEEFKILHEKKQNEATSSVEHVE